jgi:2-polyprenyl-6-methoxyphenol hydroxylase-like FAD-dependent oxidoreductase
MANEHAIIIGGSMAGLCAARVLSDFFGKVTVVDRDAYPAGAHERPGVPQSRHVHALLMRGRQELENLFPGFDRTMLEHGAIDINFGLDFAVLRRDGWGRRQHNPIETLFASRVLMEETVRGLLRKLPNVELIERADAAAFQLERGDTLRVSGLRVIPRDGRPEFTLTGQLVVDASGRATKIPGWLKELGLPAPEEEVVDSHTGYASRWYKASNPSRRPAQWWWKGVWIEPTGDSAAEAGVLFPVEGERFIVTRAGWGGKYPPSDEDGFTAQLRKLRSPIIAEEVALAEPMSNVYSYRQMANRWRHYDKWNARLDGFVALGDATCAFNPVYGQGMTSAALEALILRDCLKEHGGQVDAALPREFFARIAAFQKDPWGLATGADFSFSATEGRRPPLAARALNRVIGKMLEVGNDDPKIGDRLAEVVHMVRLPSALLDREILVRIAKAWGRRIIGRRPKAESNGAMPPLGAAPALGA